MISPSDIFHGKILIVDDQGANILLLERMLSRAGYDSITSTTDPTEVCELHRKNNYDLILLDLQMPGIDGFEVMDGLNKIEHEGYLPVLVVTSQPKHKLRAFLAGAKDFVSKPFDLSEVLARVHNMLEVRMLHNQLRNFNDKLELMVQERTSDLQESYLETIFTMTRAVEYRDTDTGFHVMRISYYSRELARLLGVDEDFVEKIYFASPMHDIGKIGIPDNILLKTGKLTPDEMEVMKGHTVMGSNILGKSKSLYLKMGADIALNHHECWDGSGYPNKLRGEAIPLAARIVHICDIYDALRSKRPYKLAFSHTDTMKIILQGDNRTYPEDFDPSVLTIFQKNEQFFDDIYNKYTV